VMNPRLEDQGKSTKAKQKEILNNYAENDEPHPQVVVAFGFLITNCDP